MKDTLTPKAVNIIRPISNQQPIEHKKQTFNLIRPAKKNKVVAINNSSQDNLFNEARINRKIADLEISNKSLLIINEMLESTVRHQARQVASFKNKQNMTVSEQDNSVIQQAECEENWDDDEQFNRLRRMTEHLIEEAQKALVYQVDTDNDRDITSGRHHRRLSSRRYNNNNSNNRENNTHITRENQ